MRSWYEATSRARASERRSPRSLIDYARAQGIGELVATVLHENRTMLDLAQRQGFTLVREANDPGTVELRLRLRDVAA